MKENERRVTKARYQGECKICHRRHIYPGTQIVEMGTQWAALECALDYRVKCRRCGTKPRMDAADFIDRWLPANQHASDHETRAVVTMSFPFEFRCYESWGAEMYIRFTFPPSHEELRTAADVLSGQRFGPFQCFCEANALVEEWFKTRTWGDDPSLANLPPHIRRIVES